MKALRHKNLTRSRANRYTLIARPAQLAPDEVDGLEVEVEADDSDLDFSDFDSALADSLPELSD